ncbi:hypothetical protein RDV77_06120 [Porphyromonadaceae sp. NP-X]|jgi:predicted nucleic acid-binding protein|nr:hypothetical protein [Porphyromonadaceae sp. NP-X]
MTIFLIVIILFGLIVVTLKVSKRHGYKKIGIVISIIIFLVILAIPLSFLFEDVFFSKNDAIEHLQEHGIILNDECKIISKEISGVMDYTLQFKLEISDADKKQIIQKFRESKHLINPDHNIMYDIRPKDYKIREYDTIMYAIYEENNYWNLQYCKVLKNGYVQTWDMIQVSKNDKKIQYIRNQ